MNDLRAAARPTPGVPDRQRRAIGPAGDAG